MSPGILTARDIDGRANAVRASLQFWAGGICTASCREQTGIANAVNNHADSEGSEISRKRFGSKAVVTSRSTCPAHSEQRCLFSACQNHHLDRLYVCCVYKRFQPALCGPEMAVKRDNSEGSM